jgi:hypothetical protein
MERIRIDYGYQQQAREDLFWKQRGHIFGLGTQLKQGHRTAWWQAVQWVLNLQHSIDDLTQGQLLAELRKGNGSIYAPVMADKIPADCPRCNRLVNIDAEGLCPGCAYEFQEND